MITTVIFDLDGLLSDTERLHYQSYQEVFSQYGITLTDEFYAQHWIRDGKGLTDFKRETGLPLDLPTIRQQKTKCYLDLVASSAKPMEGALPLLDRLSGKMKMAVASSSHEYSVKAVLSSLKIARYFDVIVSGDHVFRSKPFPDIFLYTAQQLGVEPAECIVLEDAEKGVVAAWSAGMKCLAVPNTYTRQNDFSKATKVLTSLHDVTVELLQTLN